MHLALELGKALALWRHIYHAAELETCGDITSTEHLGYRMKLHEATDFVL